MAATNVNSVTLKSRCDANGWGHTQFTVVVRYKHTQVIRNTEFHILFTFISVYTVVYSFLTPHLNLHPAIYFENFQEGNLKIICKTLVLRYILRNVVV